MYIIGKCCSIRADARPTLSELAEMLTTLAKGTPSKAMSLGARALVKEQQEEIEYDQRRAIARPFVIQITEDFDRALIILRDGTPDSLTFQAWLEQWLQSPTKAEALVEQVIDNESDAPVLNVLRRQRILYTRFYPEGMSGPLRFFAALGPMHQQNQSPRLTVEALDGGVTARIEGLSEAPEVGPYNGAILVDFLTRAVEAQ